MQIQINLLAEDVKIVRERLPKFEKQKALKNDVVTFKALAKIYCEDIQALKKAQ